MLGQFSNKFPDRRLVGLINAVRPNQRLFATVRPQGAAPNSPQGFAPIRNVGSRKIEYRLRYGPAGAMQAHHPDAAVPVSPVSGWEKRAFDLPTWRRKYQLSQTDLEDIVAPEAREGRYGSRLLADLTVELSRVCDNSVEKSVWDTLSGSVIVRFADGSTATVSTNTPDFMLPTAGTLWSNPAADIFRDVNDWLILLQDMGTEPGAIVMSKKVESYMLQNTVLLEVLKRHGNVVETNVLPQNIFDVPHFTYDGVFTQRTTVGADYTGGTSLEVNFPEEIAGIANGDVILVGPSTHASQASDNNKYARGTVSSISGSTITLTAAMQDAGSNDISFSAGNQIQWHRRFLPDNAFVILPANDGERWIECAAARSDIFGEQIAGGLKYLIRAEYRDVPYHVNLTVGIDQLPVIYVDLRYIYATVL